MSPTNHVSFVDGSRRKPIICALLSRVRSVVKSVMSGLCRYVPHTTLTCTVTAMKEAGGTIAA